ncbi:MAG: hypothetical protein ACI9JR_002094 [Gammaproteobacteria bacterium]|jgi:hypothetical protein
MHYDYFSGPSWLSSGLLPLVFTLLAIAVISLINGDNLRQILMAWRTRRLLDGIGIKQKHNMIYSDGLDGSFKVDRLVLLKDSILLISQKPYAGNIYCAEQIAEWTQVVDRKSYKFLNPLFDLDNQVTALQSFVPEIKIDGALLFDHNAGFPKGHPAEVLHRHNIPEHYFSSLEATELVLPLQKAWDALIEISQTTRVDDRPGLKS